MKKPLMGSLTPVRLMKLLSERPKLLNLTRDATKSPMLPPEAFRVPTAMSNLPDFSRESISGRMVWSCWRSASITAM